MFFRLLISLITFPGVIVHEIGHLVFCRLYGLSVHRVCYFRLGNPSGYVVHEPARSYGQAFWVSVGPLVVSTFVAALLGFPVATAFYSHGTQSSQHYVLAWLALAVGMHAFPSTGDAKNLFGASVSALFRGNLLAIIGFPVVIIIWLANLLSIIWFDAIYAVAVVFGIPWLIMHLNGGT